VVTTRLVTPVTTGNQVKKFLSHLPLLTLEILGLGLGFQKLIFCNWWVCSCVCEIVVGLGCCLDCDCDFCFDFVFGLLLVFVESFGCTVNVSHSKSIWLLRKSGKERKILV
jgi:hypothetical protein